MTITKEENDIVIRISESETGLSIQDIQDLLDYLTYRKIISKSTATQEQIDQLSRDVNKSWWQENKDKFLIP